MEFKVVEGVLVAALFWIINIFHQIQIYQLLGEMEKRVVLELEEEFVFGIIIGKMKHWKKEKVGW